ncbi:MAG: tetratricopeptide repeat protein, partial [Candidatus Hydrogenedens sp.]
MKKKETIFFLLIILFAIVIRVIYFYYISQQPEFSHPIIDPQFNDYWAHKILYQGNYPSPTGDDPMIENTPYGRPPGYPFLLAFIYFLFGDNYNSPRLIQFFVGIVNVFFMYYFVSRIFVSKKAGLVSAFLMAILWEPIYFEGEINYPVWVISLTIVLLFTSLRYLQIKTTKFVILSGFLLGIIALFRPNGLLLLPMYVGIVFHIFGKRNFKKALAHCILFSVSVFLIISPVFIRNYIVSNDFFLISCFGGINTYIGNNAQSTGDSPTVPNIIHLCGVDNWDCFNYRLLVKGLGIKQEGRYYSFKEASQFFYKKVYEYWKKEPISAIKLTARKFFLFWGPAIVSDGKVIYHDREATFLRLLPGFPFLVGLSFYFLILFIRQRNQLPPELKTLLLFIFTWSFVYSLSVIPFFVSERYRIPIIPPLCIIGGIGTVLFLSNTGNQNKLNKFKQIIICLLCLTLVYKTPVKYEPDTPRWFYHKAIVSYKSQNEKDAVYYANKAISKNPNYSEVYAFLGIISLNHHEFKEAENYCLKALEKNPDYAMANNNLGYIMELEKKFDLAEKYYYKACELSPVYTLAWINLGRMYLYYHNQINLAKDCFVKVTELDPNSWVGWFHLGNVYIQMGEYSSAEKFLTKSLSLNPENALIHNNFGFLYIQRKQYEKAIEFLKTALEKEPQFTDA